MKRIISILIAVIITVSLMSTSVFAASFSDVNASDYYYDAATALTKLGVLTGYNNGTFKPQNTILRAEMATIICRMLEKEDEVNNALIKTDFNDVNIDYWANKYINVASKLGIINGDGDGTFRPEDKVTFDEAVKMIICATGLESEVENDPSDWSAGYIALAAKKGITANVKASKGQDATRGDVAVMIYNALVMDIKAPTASLPSGTYKGKQVLELTSDIENASIYYTTDGSTPTAKSEKYNPSKPINISSSCTVKAVVMIKNCALVGDMLTVEYEIERVIPSL